MNALIWLGNGAWIAGIAVEAGKSRSCAELNAQAEAGPLMLMVRRANMGAFHSSRKGEAQRPAAVVPSGLTRPGRVSGNRLACGNIPRHHAAGADDSTIADCDPWQDD